LPLRDEKDCRVRPDSANDRLRRKIERFAKKKRVTRAVLEFVQPDQRLDVSVGTHGHYLHRSALWNVLRIHTRDRQRLMEGQAVSDDERILRQTKSHGRLER